jgi:hypothetical protein
MSQANHTPRDLLAQSGVPRCSEDSGAELIATGRARALPERYAAVRSGKARDADAAADVEQVSAMTGTGSATCA